MKKDAINFRTASFAGLICALILNLWGENDQKPLANPERAISHYSRILKKHPHQMEAYFYRGLALFATTQFQKAEADFSVFLKSFPNHAEALTMRAKSRLGQNNYAGALSDLERAIHADPSLNSETHSMKWLIWRAQKITNAWTGFSLNHLLLDPTPPDQSIVKNKKKNSPPAAGHPFERKR